MSESFAFRLKAVLIGGNIPSLDFENAIINFMK